MKYPDSTRLVWQYSFKKEFRPNEGCAGVHGGVWHLHLRANGYRIESADSIVILRPKAKERLAIDKEMSQEEVFYRREGSMLSEEELHRDGVLKRLEDQMYAEMAEAVRRFDK